jgi:Na+/proline symporter
MEELRNPTILTSLALYMAACIGVGLWALRRTHSARDFFMAGRDLGVFVTGMAVFSSTLSGFGFVGGPGLVYSMGMSSVWIVIAATIGFSISFFVLGKRLRLFAAARDTISLPDAVAARYSSESSRFLTALAILLGVVGYLATQILAMAIVLQSILERTEVFAEASLVSCMAVSCAVLVFYCVTGGIIASVYTDLVQGTVMVVASLLVFVTALYTVEGGAAGAVAAIGADDPEAIGPWGTLGVLGCPGTSCLLSAARANPTS